MGEDDRRASRCCASPASSGSRRAPPAAVPTRLLRNLRDALASAGIPAHIEVSHDRLYVAPAGAATRRAARRATTRCARVRHPVGVVRGAPSGYPTSGRGADGRRAVPRRACAGVTSRCARAASAAREAIRVERARGRARARHRAARGRRGRRPVAPGGDRYTRAVRGRHGVLHRSACRARAGCRSASRAARSRWSRAASIPRSPPGRCRGAASRSTTCSATSAATATCAGVRASRGAGDALELRRPAAPARARLRAGVGGDPHAHARRATGR